MKLVFLLDTIAVGFEPNVLPIELIGKHKYKISWIDFYCDFFFFQSKFVVSNYMLWVLYVLTG